MGWLFPYHTHTKESIVEEILSRNKTILPDTEYKWSVVKHALRGNHLWVVVRRERNWITEGKNDGKDDITFIVLYLLAYDKEEGTWGYKDIEASMGPCEHDCPIKFLDLVSENCKTSYYPDFEKNVRAHAKRKAEDAKARNKIEVGDTIMFVKPLNYGCVKDVEGIKVTYQQKKTLAGYPIDKDGKGYGTSLLRVPNVINWKRIIKANSNIIEIQNA